jgi:hypothetical protein
MCELLNVSGEAHSARGDHEVARLLWAWENEVSRSGFPTDSTVQAIMRVFRSRGWLE